MSVSSIRVAMACSAAVLASACGTDAVAGAGADPGSKEMGIFGQDPERWDLCTWDSSWYFLTVLTTDYSFGEVKSNPQSISFENAVVGNRNAVTYYDITDANHELCDVAFDSGQGVIIIRADLKGSKEKQEDMCSVAVRAANSLDQFLPSS